MKARLAAMEEEADPAHAARLRESLEEKVVVERVRHRGRRRGRRRRLRCMARRHRRVESLEEGAVDLLDLERHLNRPAQPPRQPDDGVVLWGANF